jgi:hypothetical protein
MMDRLIIPALKTLPIALALWLLLVLAIGEVTWGLAIAGLVIFAVLWILMRGKPPRPYDKPPFPDELQRWWWDGGGSGHY